MKIGSKVIDNESPCFIVAEAGVAHNGSEKAAFALIDVAIESNADAVKFQIYDTKELISKERDKGLYERFKANELPFNVFKELKEYAESKGIIWFATPHTMSAFKYLKRLNVPAYKIGSGEKPGELLNAVAGTRKPIIISTGLKSHVEIMELVIKYGSPRTAFLHCVTMYPILESLANIGFMKVLKDWSLGTNSTIGYSDHLPGVNGVELSVAMGAKIIEKHLKLPTSKGQDTEVALDGKEFKNMVKGIRRVETMMGDSFREYSGNEMANEAWALKDPSDGKRPLIA